MDFCPELFFLDFANFELCVYVYIGVYIGLTPVQNI